MIKRFRTGLICGLILFIILMAGDTTLYFAVFAVAIFGLYEFYTAIENVNLKPFKVFGIVTSVIVLLGVGIRYFEKTQKATFDIFNKLVNYNLYQTLLFILPIVFVMIFVVICVYILIEPEKFSFIDASVTIFGVLYIPAMFTFVLFIRIFPNGLEFLFIFLISVFASDTFAFLVGKYFGKHKFFPKISPNKTVEGAAGGIIGCVAIMVILATSFNYFTPIGVPIYQFIILGVFTGIISIFGDLLASSIKRYAKVKDFGKIFPGHGGILDRCDSLLFAAPLFYFYVRMFM